MTAFRVVLSLSAWAILAQSANATVEMQNEARRLGFPVHNCLYCHATAHAVDVMKEKAKAFHMSDGNCLACHGKDIPAKLNERGEWLATQRVKRGAKVADMAWLREYKEPTPPPTHPPAKAAPPKTPAP
jgi:hypothetical protein